MQALSTMRSDLTIIKPIWDYMKKQKRRRQTKSRGTVSKTFEETDLKNYLNKLCARVVDKAVLDTKGGHTKYSFDLV